MIPAPHIRDAPLAKALDAIGEVLARQARKPSNYNARFCAERDANQLFERVLFAVWPTDNLRDNPRKSLSLT